MADLSLVRRVYQITIWSSFALFIVVLVLVSRKSPPPDVAYDPHASARVEKKFAEAAQAKSSGQPTQVQLDPTELNSYLKDNLDLPGSSRTTVSGSAAAPGVNPGPPTESTNTAGTSDSSLPDLNASADGTSIEQVQSQVKDVRVDMDGDLVKAYVIFDFHGKDLSLELDGHLGSEDGYLKFDPVAGRLGSLPLPQSTLDAAVEKMLNSPENRDKLKLPDDISDIKIENGQAVVSYK
jgi:hypothetical protein